MISSTKILIQPPYMNGFSINHDEATARLVFFLTYFDHVIPLAFNPQVFPGQIFVTSTRLEQQFVLGGHGQVMQLPEFNIPDINSTEFLDGIATQCLGILNHNVGGFSLASRPDFSAQTALQPTDRVVLLLEECLPTPHHETPLEEIIAFKRDHAPQLRAFHEAVDDLYYGFGARPLDRLLPRFKDRLDTHVETISRAYELRHIKSYMGILKIGLKLAPGAIGEMVGLAAGLPIVGGVLGGAIGLLVDRTKLPTDGHAIPKDFEYILSGLSAGHARAYPAEKPMNANFIGPTLLRSVVSTGYSPTIVDPVQGDFSGSRVEDSIHL